MNFAVRSTFLSVAMKNFCRLAALVYLFLTLAPYQAEGKLLAAYISDSPSSSVPEWIAKETGLFKKYGINSTVIKGARCVWICRRVP